MFNVRPDALSPWLYVEPPQPNDPPGFRVAPDGSVIGAKASTPFVPVDYGSRVETAPSNGTDFEDAIRLVPGGLYSSADLAMFPRDPIQEALDQIARIYGGYGTNPSGPLDKRTPDIGMGTPVGNQPLSSYATGYSLPQAPNPMAPIEPTRQAGSDSLPMAETPFGSQSGNLGQLYPWLAPPPVSDNLRSPDDQGSALRWLQANLPAHLNSERLLGRGPTGEEPMSSPVSTTSEPNQSAAGMPANDVQIAQLPQQPKRNPSIKPTSKKPAELPPDQELQVRATTQASRLITWDGVIRKPLPEQLKPEMQQPLPTDWEGTLNKINPTYLKWTKAAAEKHGIPPELLARLFYKESNYNRTKGSSRGAKGIAQLTPIAVRALGLDSNKFDYLDAEKSINAGAALLAKYHGEFKDWRRAVAAYNMGNTNLKKWFDGFKAPGPNNDETQFLLQHVFRGDPNAFERKQ